MNILWNFISPVTGRVLADPNYVLVGNNQGIAIPSPILIDIRLDIVDINKSINTLSSASFVIGTPNTQLPNAQVLNALADGIMVNTAGVVSTVSPIPIGSLPNLTQSNIWIGNSDNRPVENPTISLSNLPTLSEGKLWIGNGDDRPAENSTISLSNLPSLSYNKIWIGSIFGIVIEVDATPGPEGPKGPRGDQGPPGLGFASIMKEIFKQLLGPLLGTLTADVFNSLFDSWLGSILAGGTGAAGIAGIVGRIGKRGAQGRTGIIGAQGAAAIPNVIFINTNYNMNGNHISNLVQSPARDFDLITTRWLWDLLNDNVIIIWE